MSLTSTRRDYLKQYITKTEYVQMGDRTTVCMIQAYNGYEIIGTSTCVDEKDFNKSTGELYAYQRAMENFSERFAFTERDRKHIQDTDKIEN